jgi:hypothetical protein
VSWWCVNLRLLVLMSHMSCTVQYSPIICAGGHCMYRSHSFATHVCPLLHRSTQAQGGCQLTDSSATVPRMGVSAPPPLLTALLLVLVSAAAASASTQQQEQRLTWNTFLRSPQFWPRLLQHKILPSWGAFAETDPSPEDAVLYRDQAAMTTSGAQQKPPRRPKPNPPGVPKPPVGHKPPPPGLGPKPPPLGLGATCSGRITEQCVIPAGAQVSYREQQARGGVGRGKLSILDAPRSRCCHQILISQLLVLPAFLV